MIRKAEIKDLKQVVDLKMEMFEESGEITELTNNAVGKILESYSELYVGDEAVHFLIEEDGEVIAMAGGILKHDIPYCFYKSPYYGFIVDVYTSPKHSGMGYSDRLVEEVIKWLKEKNATTVKIAASAKEKAFYEKLGFHPSGEMVKKM